MSLHGIPSLIICLIYFRYECNHFGVAEPSFPIAEELKQDLAVNEAMWQIYEEFSNGIEDLAKEDWISFR